LQDTYVSAFRSVAPQGTHHAVLTISDTGTDGEYDCNSGNLDSRMLYSSGVGTDDLMFPSGVAIKLKAGQKLNINLHLFNTSDQPISGTSGVAVKKIPMAQVVNEAEMFFGGTFNITVPPGGAAVEQSGGCTLGANTSYTVFSLWPHMHQIGVHQKVTHRRGTTTTTLLDSDYDFNEQKFYPLAAPLSVLPNDELRVTCTYRNNTGATIKYGDSSTEEMCFSGMYRYPVQPAGFLFDCAPR
jgi:hypothetical protein